MANNNDKQQIDENVQDAEVVTEKNRQPAVHRAVWIALAIILLLLVIGASMVYQNLNQKQAQIDDLSASKSQLEGLSTSLAQSRQQLASLEEQQQALSASLQAIIARDNLTSAEIQKTWALQEISYLLNVANQRALLAHDVKGAYQALGMADEQIQAIGDYRLHPLRALIAEEMMALDALADVDIAGIAIKLQTAANRVQTLRVKKGPELSTTSVTMESESVSPESGWQQALSDIWQQLRSLVVIRHDQSGESAVLVPEQRYFLYQNLRLQLESARFALMNSDNASYQHSLQTAVSWLQQYFTGDERDGMLNSLQQLQSMQVDVALPDLSGSLNWLEEYQQ